MALRRLIIAVCLAAISLVRIVRVNWLISSQLSINLDTYTPAVESNETVTANDTRTDEEYGYDAVPSISYQKGDPAIKPSPLRLGPIFYNLYVPIQLRNSSEPNVTSIVWEQLSQIKKSSPQSTLLYTLILDEKDNVPNSYADQIREAVQQLCSGDCREREHVRQGSEAAALGALRDYCRADEKRDDEIVTYLHDKGSFHSNDFNHKARRFATKAALECRKSMMNHSTACNVCSAKFVTYPQYLFSANMWSTTCQYAKDLYPPDKYQDRMQKLYDSFLMNVTLADNFACYRPTNTSPNHIGTGRYAMERWVGSHPFVRPCSIMPIGIPSVPQSFEDQDSWKPTLSPPPTRGGMKWNSFARLDGRLLEWSFVYPGRRIPVDSWIWTYYRGREHGEEGWMEMCQNRSSTSVASSL